MNQRWNSNWNDFDRFFATLSPYREPEPTLSASLFRQPTVRSRDEARGITVEERAEDILVTMAIPGLSERDVKVSLADDVLTIEGRREISVPEGYAAIRRERSNMSFSHRMELPTGVDSERASAVVKHGVLTLTLPKHPSVLPKEIVVRGEN